VSVLGDLHKAGAVRGANRLNKAENKKILVSEYVFGLGPGHLPKRAASIATKFGRTRVNLTPNRGKKESQVKAALKRSTGFGCSPIGAHSGPIHCLAVRD